MFKQTVFLQNALKYRTKVFVNGVETLFIPNRIASSFENISTLIFIKMDENILK